MSVSIQDSVVGRVFGSYRVLGHLGGDLESSLGDDGSSLYVAEHQHLERRVALRLIAANTGGAAGRDGFLTEVRKLSRIGHANLLDLIDMGEAGDGRLYVVMELPEGPTLDQVIAEHAPIAGARARRIGAQIGLALQAAIRASFLHGEITPGHIFLTSDGEQGDLVKIDFASFDMLAADVVVGLDGVRALGDILYQMVVGQPPAPDAPVAPKLLRPDLDIPADLDSLIMRALDSDPANRWLDLGAMLRGLMPVAVGAESEAPARGTAEGRVAPHVAAEGRVAAAAHGAPENGAVTPGAPARQTDVHPPVDSSAPTVVRLFGRTLFPGPSPKLIAGGVVAVFTLVLGIALGGTRRDSSPAGDTPGRAAPSARPSTPSTEPSAATTVPGTETVAVAAPAPPSATEPTVDATQGTTTGPFRPAPSAPARAVAEAALPRKETGASVDTKRVAADSGIAAAGPPRDDQGDRGKAVGTGRAGSGDDACAVTLGANPWSEVWIDGRQAGFTPLIDYPVDCGPHEVAFKSSESDIEKRLSITVVSGHHFKKVVDLTAGATAGAPTGTLVAAVAGPPAGTHAGTGCLVTLGSRPWSELWIDGKQVGVTPLVEYALSCGKHEVVFRSADLDVERRETIVVKRGRTLKKVVALAEPAP